MKLLLVALNAKYIHSNLAVYSLKANAGTYANNCKIAEFTINHAEEDILREVYRERAEVVAFSCYIWNIEMITRITKELKKVQPGVIIWYGGPEVSYDAQKCLELNPELTGIMIGEGEQTFRELLEYYSEDKKELSSIAGLAFRDNDTGNIITTALRPLLDLNDLQFPYEEVENFQNRIIYYESSRGCPFSCSYCLSSIDKTVRFRKADLVKQELKLLMEQQVPQIKFVDRTFNCNREHAMAIWQFLKENDNGTTNFHFEISADLLSEEEIEFLSTLRPGQIQFEIGVQTTNPDTVEAIHRRMDFEKLRCNVSKIKAGNNIHQHLDLIAGLPLEGFDSFEKSFYDVYCMKPDQLQLGFLKVLKGAMMEKDSERYGITFRNNAPYEVLYTKHLSFDELLKIKSICEMVEVYYNSGQFSYTMNFLEHLYPSSFKLYQAISDYYEAKGYHMLAHNRIRRYEILLEFYIDKISQEAKEFENGSVLTSVDKISDMEKKALFEEILLLDMYLREDLKGKPAFIGAAPEVTNLRDYYDKYKKERRQIHIEPFRFDVIASAVSGKAIRKNTLLLFDYGSRDPLNKAAKITEL